MGERKPKKRSQRRLRSEFGRSRTGLCLTHSNHRAPGSLLPLLAVRLAALAEPNARASSFCVGCSSRCVRWRTGQRDTSKLPPPSQPLNLFLNTLLTAPLHFYPARDGRLLLTLTPSDFLYPPLPADSSLVPTSFFGQRFSQLPFLSPPPDLILPTLQACSTIQTSPRLARRQSR